MNSPVPPQPNGRACQGVRLQTPAKINLYLGVSTARDSRGYHLAHSCMAAVGLFDLVTVERADRLSVSFAEDSASNFPEATCAADKNTCFKAATLMGEAFGFTPQVRITVDKHIPAQAGLGGSSSDAVATMRALCFLYDLHPTQDELAAVAKQVGADVPFFLTGHPAWFSGAGDVLAQSFPYALPELPVVLVRPSGPGVSTPAAYQNFDACPTPAAELTPFLEALKSVSPELLAAQLSNNLEPVAQRIHPACAEVLAWLKAQPQVLAAQISGSGSCSFALCGSPAAAAELAAAARQRPNLTGEPWWSCATHTYAGGPELIGSW